LRYAVPALTIVGVRETPEERLRVAFDLYEAAETIMRENLRRRNREASAEEIERLLDEWLESRPGAPFGDADGVPVVR
jgi:hypothetical protein